jgi:hypothetical protein
MFWQKISIVDVLIVIPLIPLLALIVTWWLPWERWLPGKIPKHVLGLYLLYALFAAWHFSMPWWVILAVAMWGTMMILVNWVEEHVKRKGN